MPLQFQVVDVKFTKGLDTRTQRKLVMPGKWDTLLNYSLSEDNTPQRRDGVQALVPTANGNGLATYAAQLLSINGGAVSSVSTASTVATANAVTGRLGYVGISKTEVQRSTGMQDTPDCATGGGFTCYVWRELSAAAVSTGVNVMLVDETTGAQLIGATSMRAFGAGISACPRVVFANGVFFIFYMNGGTSLFCRTIRTSAPTVLNAEVALITSASFASGINIDACAFGTNSAMVSYGWADGVTSVRTIQVISTAGVPSINAGPTNLFTEAQLPAATLTGLCCAAYSDASHAATFATSTGAAAMAGLAGRVIGTNWATTTVAVQLDAAVAATTRAVHVTAVINDAFTSVALQVFWDRQSEWATNALNPVRSVLVTNAMVPTGAAATVFNSATFGVGTTARGPQGPFIAGKAFTDGSRIFLPVFVGSVYNTLSPATANPRNANTQNTLFVLDCNAAGSLFGGFGTPTVVAKALYGSYGLASINGVAPTVATPCSVIQPSSGSFALVAGELTLLVLASGNNVSPTGLVRIGMTPNSTVAPSRAQLGESGYFAGGSLSTYDGAAIIEHGFPLFPEGPAIAANGAGTGSMTAGVHQVVFIYEWVDNAGQRHQSAPSLPISVTVVGTGSLTCVVPTLLLSQKPNIQVVAFMTQAAGLTFNRVLLDNGIYAPVLNTTAATTVTVTIDDSDATIVGNEVLYTQPNQAGTTLPNLAPGPCSYVWSAQNRLWFNKSDKPLWFGFTQEYLNNVGLQFNPNLEDSLPAESGGFVAGSALDEKVIVFGRDRIYAKYGTGPTTSGGFNNYSKPIDVQSDVGCSDPLSVLDSGPGGILFKSLQGWHVLKRDLSVEYIGDGVSTYDTATVTSAVLMGDRKEARFTVSTGFTLVLSTLIGEWSVFQYAGEVTVADAVWWPTTRRYVWTGATAGINNDVPGVLDDSVGLSGATSFSTLARTGWLKIGALEGFQRVRWLYLSMTADAAPTSVQFSITVDYDDVYGGPNTEALGLDLSAITFPSAQAIDLRHKIVKQQKCKSIAFTIRDSPAQGDQPLSGLQALALELGLKKGVNRLPAGQSY